MYFSNLQQAVSGGQRAKQQKGQSAYSSQYNSSKRKQNDTSCTVLNGTSNNEVLDENFISSFLHLQATSNKVANQSKEQSAEKQQQAIRSVDVSRRSQSGEGNKVLQNDGLNSKHQSLMKNSNASKKIKNSFQNFLANQQDLDFLTKTIGCAPSVPITATKSFHNVNKSGEQHHSSSGVKATGKLQKSIYKSFQNYPHLNGSSVTPHSQVKNKHPANLELLKQKSSATPTTNNSSSLSNKFLTSLKAFTQNYFGAQHKKNKKNKKKQKRSSNQNRSPKRDKSEPQIVKDNMMKSRQMHFGQIMEELEKFSLTNKNLKDRNPELPSAQSSFCESVQEFTEQGYIRMTTNRNDYQSKRRDYKSEERKAPQYFTKEFLHKRYVNERVEMELEEFKQEIEKKFAESAMKGYQFPFERPTQSASHQHPTCSRGQSMDDYLLCADQEQPEKRNKIYKSTCKPSNNKTRKQMDISSEMPRDIMKTCDFRQAVPLSLKGTEDNRQDYASIAAMSQPTYDNRTASRHESKKAKPLFTNFKKQAAQKPKLSKSVKKGIQCIKSNNDFNSLSQFTMDLSNPQMTSSFANQKLGNHLVKGSSQAVSGVRLQNNQQSKHIQSQKQTPKNYSLQLNQVVKHILGGQQLGLNTSTSKQGLDLQSDQCFFSTESDQKGLATKPSQLKMYRTNDCRQSRKKTVEDSFSQQSSRSKVAKNRTRLSQEPQKRSASSNSNYKQGLINKYFRISNLEDSPEGKTAKSFLNMAGHSKARKNQATFSFNNPNQSNCLSNASTGRVKSFLSKPTSQSRQPSSRVNVKSSQKCSRYPSTSKKLKECIGNQVHPQKENNPLRNEMGSRTSKQVLKSNQIKRAKDEAEPLNQCKAKKNIKSTKQQQMSLMQRSFCHQPPTINQRTSVMASPNMTSSRKTVSKSRQKVATQINSNRQIDLGVFQPQSQYSSGSLKGLLVKKKGANPKLTTSLERDPSSMVSGHNS